MGRSGLLVPRPRTEIMRPRILVVSYYGANPLTPRGARTQAVVGALRRDADVLLVSGPRPPGRRDWRHRLRDRILWGAGSRWMLDPVEPWARRALRSNRPGLDAALLLAHPFSPVIFAAKMLKQQGVPYVVDASDPWALTLDRSPKNPWHRRRATNERMVWESAAGGIMTTDGQARALRAAVPDLDLLVRPNGYTHVDMPARSRRPEPGGELRIAHFGMLYAPRIHFSDFLRRLAASQMWRRIVLLQYGRDHYGVLDGLPDVVRVETRAPIPWHDVVRLSATDLDIALVVGNTDPRQLPSKAIEYMTLPVPRLAITSGVQGDALSDHVMGKPGWLVLNVDEPAPASLLAQHVCREWTAEQLLPPPEDAWDRVASEISSFVLSCCGRSNDQPRP
jgi:hypothetical protein